MKTIIITGVSQGLGLALADKFCDEGHTVYGCARSAGETQKLLETYPDRFFFEKVDVTDASLVDKWAQGVIKNIPRLDFLINNAGIINKNAPVWKLSQEEVRAVMDINVLAVFSCLRAFLPFMISNKKGVVINMSSGWGRSAAADLSPYCASKYAIEGLTKSVAQELPSGVGIVSLDPREGVQTEMLKSCLPDYHQEAPDTKRWAATAAPYILSLTEKDNGKELICPAIL